SPSADTPGASGESLADELRNLAELETAASWTRSSRPRSSGCLAIGNPAIEGHPFPRSISMNQSRTVSRTLADRGASHAGAPRSQLLASALPLGARTGQPTGTECG